MPEFAANLTMLYQEFDFLARFAAAAKLSAASIKLLNEPINNRDIPGFFKPKTTTSEGLSWLTQYL